MDCDGHVHGDVDKGFGYYRESDLESILKNINN